MERTKASSGDLRVNLTLVGDGQWGKSSKILEDERERNKKKGRRRRFQTGRECLPGKVGRHISVGTEVLGGGWVNGVGRKSEGGRTNKETLQRWEEAGRKVFSVRLRSERGRRSKRKGK